MISSKFEFKKRKFYILINRSKKASKTILKTLLRLKNSNLKNW